MFEFSQLRCFVAVAEELHFSRAADRLHMTQPPLSRQIRLLEHQVGAQLLDRSSRVVRLTAAGKAFFPHAARMLRQADEAASIARKVASGDSGSIAIGFTAALGYGVLPDIVHRLRRRCPGIALTLKEMVTAAQLEALDAGQLDIGLMRPHVEQVGLASVALAHEALMLAIPQRDAGQWPQQPALGDLSGKAFLMYSPYEARYFHQLLTTMFERAKVQPEVVEYVSQIHTMLALVSAGVGAALIPEAASRLQFEGIVLRRLHTRPARPVEMVASHRHDNTNPVLRILLDEVLGKPLEPRQD